MVTNWRDVAYTLMEFIFEQGDKQIKKKTCEQYDYELGKHEIVIK